MKEKGKVAGVNGPVVTARGSKSFQMLEMVFVGHEKLMGEVIAIENDDVIIQVYESTTGLRVSEPVFSSGQPLSLMLGPGIIGGVFDGIQRPLQEIENLSGSFIKKGLEMSSLDLEKGWPVEMLVKEGDKIEGGNV